MRARSLVQIWLAVTIGVSILAALDGGWTASWLALDPSRVWHGQVWRLVTWPWVQHGPIPLVVTCALIYKLGGDLSVRWGERRLRRFVAQVIVAAAVVACVADALAGGDRVWRLGGWAITDVLLIAWARQFPTQALVMYWVLVVRGRQIVRLVVAVNLLFAIFFGAVRMMPELVACAAAALYPRALLSR
ncbi:MAG TPA: hypothetical protein VGF94_26470 [Kofleriaceae bacterium]